MSVTPGVVYKTEPLADVMRRYWPELDEPDYEAMAGQIFDPATIPERFKCR